MMTNPNTLSITSEIEEKISVYARAVCGLYERMLNYANCKTQINPDDYSAMRNEINLVYNTDEIGFDLETRLRDGSKREQILSDLEEDYKRTCLIYKDLFAESLNIEFENELEPDFAGNTFPDPEDQKSFESLLENTGKRVFAQILKNAADDDPYYQLLAGKCFFLGWGTRPDMEKGLEWIKRAAESGDSDALLYAGMAEETVHFNQTGYRFNPESLAYYEKAYDAGNPEAAYALYRFNSYHMTDYSSIRAAKRWLRRGLEDNSIYCSYINFKKPKGPWAPGNVKNAYDWVCAAAIFKEPEAYELLADLYGKGHAGLIQDKSREEECLEMVEQLT